jgi:hypothetical protein
VNSTVAALALLAAAAGPGVRHTGSAQFRVSVNVVAPLSASAPEIVTLSPDAAGSSSSGMVAHLPLRSSIRGGQSAVLVGAPGGAMRGCSEAVNAGCEVAVPSSPAAEPVSPVVVVAFVAGGAPPASVGR